MIKLQDVLNEGKKYKKHWSYEAYDSKEEDFFDEVEFQLEKMFPKAKDWEINDYIYSIFDVMSDDEWLNKHSGLNQKAILKHAKRKGLKPIKKPIGEAKKRDSRGTLRDYKKEYKRDHSSSKAKEDRAKRNAKHKIRKSKN